MRIHYLVAAAATLITAACGTSQTYHHVTTEQTNDAWQPRPINRVAVVAITTDRGERVGSETVFVDHLQQKGFNVIASYQFAPALTEFDTTSEASSTWAGQDVDAVLTIGVAEPAAGYDRSAYWEARGWAWLLGSDRGQAWGNLADSASYWQQGEYSLDIGLWDAHTMQPIWHAQTDSNEWDEGSSGVARLADSVADMLIERGFVQ